MNENELADTEARNARAFVWMLVKAGVTVALTGLVILAVVVGLASTHHLSIWLG